MYHQDTSKKFFCIRHLWLIYHFLIFKFLFSVFFVLLCQICFAQELEVVEPLHSTIFEIVEAQDKKYDANGVPCAVVKVQLPVAGVAFEGNVIESQFHINEYWVWFTSGTNGTKKFRIKCPGAQMLEVDVNKTIPDGLQPDGKYAIKLNLPKDPSAKQSYSDLNQKIYTVSINAHSSESVTFLGKEVHIPMDSVTVKRYNRDGLYISSKVYDSGLLSGNLGEYKILIGAVEGDILEVTAKGYQKKTIPFTNPNVDTYDIILYPQKIDVQFILKDAGKKETLIGGTVYKNPVSNFDDWDNWGERSGRKIRAEEVFMSDFDGRTGVFNNVKATDKFMFTYPRYKDMNFELSAFSDNQEGLSINTIEVELEPYEIGETKEVKIHIGGMGIDDKGKVTVTNTGNGDSFTMSQRYGENFKDIMVTIGDELLFTRRGYRPVYVKFNSSLPDRIDIAPLKGNDSDAQYLEF